MYNFATPIFQAVIGLLLFCCFFFLFTTTTTTKKKEEEKEGIYVFHIIGTLTCKIHATMQRHET